MPGHEAEGAHLELAAERLVLLPQAVDLGHHRLGRLGVQAADGRVVDPLEVLGREVVALGRAHRGDLDHVAEDAHADRGEKALRDRARRDPRRGLARAGALEHVADVGEAELLQPRQVRVAGSREVRLLDLRVDGPGVHPLIPVRVVAVGDQDRDRAAQRPAVANARADLDRVALDLHAAATAMAELAPRHVAIERLAIELEPGRAGPRRSRPGRGRGTRPLL